MDEFESQRAHLRAVAYRILGRAGDVDDALQEAWLRYRRAGRSEVRDARAWLTMIDLRHAETAVCGRRTVNRGRS